LAVGQFRLIDCRLDGLWPPRCCIRGAPCRGPQRLLVCARVRCAGGRGVAPLPVDGGGRLGGRGGLRDKVLGGGRFCRALIAMRGRSGRPWTSIRR